jgi:hypothetical protein
MTRSKYSTCLALLFLASFYVGRLYAQACSVGSGSCTTCTNMMDGIPVGVMQKKQCFANCTCKQTPTGPPIGGSYCRVEFCKSCAGSAAMASQCTSNSSACQINAAALCTGGCS